MQSCDICYDSFDGSSDAERQKNGDESIVETTEKKVVSTLCGHVFHGICMEEWLKVASSCPICRKPVSKKELIKLFVNFSGDKNADGKKNCDKTLDMLKEKLRAKDLKCAINEERIKVLLIECARSTEFRTNMLQREKEYKNEISVLKKEVVSLSNKAEIQEKWRVSFFQNEEKILIANLQHCDYLEILFSGIFNEISKILTNVHIHLLNVDESEVLHRLVALYSSLKCEYVNYYNLIVRRIQSSQL